MTPAEFLKMRQSDRADFIKLSALLYSQEPLTSHYPDYFTAKCIEHWPDERENVKNFEQNLRYELPLPVGQSLLNSTVYYSLTEEITISCNITDAVTFFAHSIGQDPLLDEIDHTLWEARQAGTKVLKLEKRLNQEIPFDREGHNTILSAASLLKRQTDALQENMYRLWILRESYLRKFVYTKTDTGRPDARKMRKTLTEKERELNRETVIVLDNAVILKRLLNEQNTSLSWTPNKEAFPFKLVNAKHHR